MGWLNLVDDSNKLLVPSVIGNTMKIHDLPWEHGLRDTFSLCGKECFIVGISSFSNGESYYLNFVKPNFHKEQKHLPIKIPIRKEFLFNSKILLIEEIKKK